ncbi:MAG: pre-peptidase C-terminal domain-containing protein [Planctomycetia bacterium]|nr:pre-peptidase C-terminal domain-containing protein [Planctomycetia bacterium]
MTIRFSTFVCLSVALFLALTGERSFAQGISYVYPAGAARGTTTKVYIVGGGANAAKDVFVSGSGVSAKIIARENSSGFRFQDPYSGKCSGVMQAILDEEARIMALRDDPRRFEEARKSLRTNRKKRKDATKIAKDDIPTPDDEEVFRSFMYFHTLEKPTIDSMQLLYYEYRKNDEERKYHSPGGGICVLEVTVDPDAEPGLREIQYTTAGGISRPARFWISPYTEVTEIEPNEIPIWPDFKAKFKTYAELPPQTLPVVYNGQIKPGDLDRFYFQGKAGQRVVFEIQSRSTMPYIANAVPGWFVAYVALFDPDGKKIKSCDSWRFDQNPMMLVKLPASGRYMIEVRDAIWRGRNDFVYRVAVGELPIVYSQFPLGGPAGQETAINILGGNLTTKTVSPDYSGEIYYEEERTLENWEGMNFARPLRYFVETLPIVHEPAIVGKIDLASDAPGSDAGSSSDPNAAACPTGISPPVKVTAPTVIYGRIDKPNEIDVYEFQGKKDQAIVLDTVAQRLGSALDTVVELYDAAGTLVGSNDDPANHTGPNIGDEVHHSDAHLEATLPADGTYTAHIFGRLRKSGPEYFYRLRISEPQPDFTLLTVPSALAFRAADGKLKTSFKVIVFRKEGFTGPITLSCSKPGEHFQFEPNTIGGEETTKQVTLTCNGTPPEGAFELVIRGTADFGDGRQVVRTAQGADDWEQAFIWHHWVNWCHLMGVQL